VDLGSEVAMAWCTSEEQGDPRFNLNTRFSGLAALMIAKLSVYPSDSAILDESTSRDYQRNSIWHYSSYCGPALALSVFYSTALCIDRDYVRENLEEYVDLLFDEYPGIGGLFFQQIASDAILKGLHFKELCAVIDDRQLLTEYISWRNDAAIARRDFPLLEIAETSFVSLSEDEIRRLSNYIRDTAFEEDNCTLRYACEGPPGSNLSTESELRLVMDMTACLALLKGPAQIAAADQLLKNDRLFGLSAYSLLTCPWYPEQTRAVALQRMAQEDPIIGREMAKIVLLREREPAVLEAARQILV
jgi:hypothetical protein